jgi:hypothetical protein
LAVMEPVTGAIVFSPVLRAPTWPGTKPRKKTRSQSLEPVSLRRVCGRFVFSRVLQEAAKQQDSLDVARREHRPLWSRLQELSSSPESCEHQHGQAPNHARQHAVSHWSQSVCGASAAGSSSPEFCTQQHRSSDVT